MTDKPIFSLKNPLPNLDNLGDIFNILLSLAFFVAGVAMFFNLVIGRHGLPFVRQQAPNMNLG